MDTNIHRRQPVRVDTQDGSWSVSVAESPHDLRSYSLYIKTPTHNLTLTRTAMEILELDQKLRETNPNVKIPPLRINADSIPPPPKRKSNFLNTLSRLASPTSSKTNRRNTNPLLPTLIASPTGEINNPFTSFSASNVNSPSVVAAPSATSTGIAAYLTTISNTAALRQGRVWKRFVRVRTDDLESVRVERAITRVRSDLAAHVGGLPKGEDNEQDGDHVVTNGESRAHADNQPVDEKSAGGGDLLQAPIEVSLPTPAQTPKELEDDDRNEAQAQVIDRASADAINAQSHSALSPVNESPIREAAAVEPAEPPGGRETRSPSPTSTEMDSSFEHVPPPPFGYRIQDPGVFTGQTDEEPLQPVPVFDRLQGIPDQVSASDWDSPSEEAIVNLLQTQVLGSKVNYKALLEMEGTSAQRILNVFQQLLDSPNVVDHMARRSILMALLRLAAACGHYPQQLKLDNIQREPSPVTAGQFGEVYKGQYKDQQVCLKIFKLYQRSQIDHLNKYFSREAIVWSQLDHPNVLPFYGIYHALDPHPRIGLVSPWMSNGNLSEYLAAHPNTLRLPFVHDVPAGLQYLHQNQIVHGDLKGVNILICKDGSACLADFGLSSVMDADILRWSSLETMTRAGGTVRWTAPEMIEGTEEGGPLRPTFASDVYSLASVMIEIFTGQIPYYEYPRDLTVLSKVNRGIRPARPGHETAPELTDHIWAIMQDCWRDVPSDRPTVDEAIERLLEDGPSLPWLRAAQAELWNNISAQRNSKLSVSDIGFLSDTFKLVLLDVPPFITGPLCYNAYL